MRQVVTLLRRGQHSWKTLTLAAAGASAALGLLLLDRRLARVLRPADPGKALAAGRSLLRGPRRILAVTAHPDDLEFFASGTLRLLVLAGSEVSVVVATDGEKAVHQRNLAQTRQLEQEKAQSIIGYSRVSFLHLPDRNLATDPRFVPALKDAWDRVRPEVVFAFDYARPLWFIKHLDHLAAGMAAARLAAAEPPGQVDLVFYATGAANALVDISGVLEDKTAAVLSHRSQLRFPPAVYGWLVRRYAAYVAGGIPAQFAEHLRYVSPSPVSAKATGAARPARDPPPP